MKTTIKKIPFLDYACEEGERVQWKNLLGERFEGIIKEWDGNIAILTLDDGTDKFIEC